VISIIKHFLSERNYKTLHMDANPHVGIFYLGGGYYLADNKRVIEGYEEMYTVQLAGGEVIFAENKNVKERYMVCDCSWNNLLGVDMFTNGVAGADFLGIMKEFIHRLSERAVKLEAERELRGIPQQMLTNADCHPIGDLNLEGLVVVIKPEALLPEYRSIDYQLALCTGGFGAMPNSRGRAVYCTKLFSGKSSRFNRSDIAGVLSEEQLPDWARDKLQTLRQSRANEAEAAIAKPLDKEQFWQIIDSARETAGGWKGMLEPLVNALSRLEEQDIIRWKQIFDVYQDLAYKDKLWAAADWINDGCSDDGFTDFRGWLTAQGKDVFLKALENPDSLAELEIVKSLGREIAGSEYMPNGGYENWAYFESILYSASYAYEKKFGSDADIYKVINTPLLSEQEKADIASEVKYAADIDCDEWRKVGNLNQKAREMFPNLYIAFKEPDNPEVDVEVAKPEKQPNHTPTEKESVLEQLRKDKQSKQAKGNQQEKSKAKKQSKSGPEL
jgi:hypothetical protein